MLKEGQSYLIGRDAKAQYRIETDIFVSAIHAELFWMGHDLWIKDLESSNGPMVKGSYLNHPQIVQVDQPFLVGSTALALRHAEEALPYEGRLKNIKSLIRKLPRLTTLLNQSANLAVRMGQGYVDTRHLLCALFALNHFGLNQLLNQWGLAGVRQQMINDWTEGRLFQEDWLNEGVLKNTYTGDLSYILVSPLVDRILGEGMNLALMTNQDSLDVDGVLLWCLLNRTILLEKKMEQLGIDLSLKINAFQQAQDEQKRRELEEQLSGFPHKEGIVPHVPMENNIFLELLKGHSLLLHGPPRSGKSALLASLCDHARYLNPPLKLHYFDPRPYLAFDLPSLEEHFGQFLEKSKGDMLLLDHIDGFYGKKIDPKRRQLLLHRVWSQERTVVFCCNHDRVFEILQGEKAMHGRVRSLALEMVEKQFLEQVWLTVLQRKKPFLLMPPSLSPLAEQIFQWTANLQDRRSPMAIGLDLIQRLKDLDEQLRASLTPEVLEALKSKEANAYVSQLLEHLGDLMEAQSKGHSFSLESIHLTPPVFPQEHTP
jgi:pSer/pThr/pTyr-binding forkhead associated (FHA) protein